MDTIESFVGRKGSSFLALSMFLLITISLFSLSNGYFNNLLALLSAGASYFLMVECLTFDGKRDDFLLILFRSFFMFFIGVFCVWVISNLILPYDGLSDLFMILIWIGFISYIPYRVLDRKGKIVLVVTWMILLLYIMITGAMDIVKYF